MRVFHVISGFENGGVEALLARLVSHMPRDIEFHVVAHEVVVPDCAARFRELGIAVHLIPPRKRLVQHQRALRRLFAQYRPDVVHVHTTEWGVLALTAAKRVGVRCRIQHSHAARREKNPFLRLLHGLLLCRARHAATALFACGETAARLSFGKAALAQGRVTVLKNGIDTNAFAFDERLRRSTRAALCVDENTTLIGMVARFSPQKNHKAALTILEACRRVEPSAVLLLIGEGRLRAEIEAKAAEMLPEGAVRFLGVRHDMPALYAAMDRFMLPSRFEGLPITLIEAAAAGLPAVVADTVAREADLCGLVTFADTADTEKWVKALLAPTQCARTGYAAQVRAAGYEIETVAAELYEFYQQHT